jgi:hypothetical protein
LKKPGDRSEDKLAKNEECHSSTDLKVLHEDNEEKIELIDLTGSSQSMTSDQDKNSVKDKVK